MRYQAEKFQNVEEYKEWIEKQDWYQTIHLKYGLVAKGRFKTHNRVSVLEEINFDGKTVLDIGCNSGQNSFVAKKGGAKKVVGVDIDIKRIRQARVLAINEGLEVDFQERGIFDLSETDASDIVLCIAVLTEITDLLGAIEQIKKVTKERALLELNLARPLLYFSLSKFWIKGYKNIPRMKALSEMRQIKDGRWVISPTIEMLQVLFGDAFSVREKKGGVRYDLVEIFRLK